MEAGPHEGSLPSAMSGPQWEEVEFPVVILLLGWMPSHLGTKSLMRALLQGTQTGGALFEERAILRPT